MGSEERYSPREKALALNVAEQTRNQFIAPFEVIPENRVGRRPCILPHVSPNTPK